MSGNNNSSSSNSGSNPVAHPSNNRPIWTQSQIGQTLRELNSLHRQYVSILERVQGGIARGDILELGPELSPENLRRKFEEIKGIGEVLQTEMIRAGMLPAGYGHAR